MFTPDDLARLRCRVVSAPLGPGPDPFAVMRAAAREPGLICLTGAWAGGGTLITVDPLLVAAAEADPFTALGRSPHVDAGADGDTDVVGGGWFTELGYDGRSRLAWHDHLLRHRDGQWFFEALWSGERAGELRVARRRYVALLERAGDARAPWQVGRFDLPDAERHLAAVERAVELIRAGEIYQVNVCTRLRAAFSGSPAGLFADVAARLRPAYGAFVAGQGTALAGLSPELFLLRRGRRVRTSPIKGTRPCTADGAGRDELRASVKDIAENVMIVDLMRSDLGRVCEPGSVRSARLLDVEAHPGVWHLVSTVEGRLRDGVGDGDLLRASFPPGSVTGAPKRRAMTVVDELEATGRGSYTGAVGFSSPTWGAQFAVTIRSFEIAAGRIELGVGGGVTVDSVPMQEWQECLTKAQPLLAALGERDFPADSRVPRALPRGRPICAAESAAGGERSLLETVLAVDGVVLRLEDHLARLDRSARELYGRGAPAGLAGRVEKAVAGMSGRVAVRIVLAPGGAAEVRATAASEPPRSSEARVVPRREGLWRHKWADRAELAAAEAEVGGVPLFVAADGTVLETSRGNVFLLREDGGLVTPPLRDDLLPGVTRRAVLDLARDEGRAGELRSFTVGELREHVAFWTSSLSLAVPIASVGGIGLPRRDAEVRALAQALGTVERLKTPSRKTT